MPSFPLHLSLLNPLQSSLHPLPSSEVTFLKVFSDLLLEFHKHFWGSFHLTFLVMLPTLPSSEVSFLLTSVALGSPLSLPLSGHFSFLFGGYLSFLRSISISEPPVG